MEPSDILQTIQELAFVRIGKSTIDYTPPLVNVWGGRSGAVLKYLGDYAAVRGLRGDFFLCLYDGWREYSVPSQQPEFVPWAEVNQTDFLGQGSAGEPRFRHLKNTAIFPELPLPVITFCKHHNDKNAVLIPDAEFLGDGFSKFAAAVRKDDCMWKDKSHESLFWRGSPNTCARPDGARHPRDLVCSLSGIAVDASFSGTTEIKDFLRHRYLLDVDGMVSAWSGLYWKLLSNSLPVKLQSHWVQWYYGELAHGVNVWITDANFASTLDVLNRTASESLQNIAARGSDLAESLTYEYAVDGYVIV